jgi:cytochrome c peroxidase
MNVRRSLVSFSKHAAIIAIACWMFMAIHARANATSEQARIALGERLFFDKRLSGDGQISCASCHQPERAFSDGLATARGIGGQMGKRNTPSLLNVDEQRTLFWDGRRASLESQVADPFTNPIEHGLTNTDAVVAKVRADTGYAGTVSAAFGIRLETLTFEQIAVALAAFQRSLKAQPSPFERYWLVGEETAISDRAKRGLALFRGIGGCAQCHVLGTEPQRSAALTDNQFHDVSVNVEGLQRRLPDIVQRAMHATPEEIDRLVSQDADIAALGRFLATKNPRDIGKFKTPSLRNVAVTAPYMHDGAVATLEQAIDVELYYRSAQLGKAVVLTPAEKQDIKSFLETLTNVEQAGSAALLQKYKESRK